MEVGEYIRRLLNDRDISLTDLSKRINIKSRNTLYRMFDGRCSHKLKKELIENIVEAVDFSESELRKIYQLLECGKDGKIAEKTNKILFNIYNGGCFHKGGGNADGKKGLYSALKSCTGENSGECVVIMSEISRIETVLEIFDFLKENPAVINLKIYHYIFLTSKSLSSAYELFALLKLAEFENYVPLKAVKNGGFSVPELVILNKSAKGFYMYREEYPDGQSIFLETDISGSFYEYELKKNDILLNKASVMKRPVKRVADYINIMKETNNLNLSNSFFSEGAPCFGYLPADILIEMFGSINYFGFPKEHPYVRSLIDLVTDREKPQQNVKTETKMLFDADVLSQMMKTGYSVDHAAEFPPMNVSQRRKYFEGIIKLAKSESQGYHFRFLKRMSVGCSYVFSENQFLYIYRSKTGYTDGSVIVIRDKNINEIMKRFTEYIWENHTLGDKESIAETEKLMKKYLGS